MAQVSGCWSYLEPRITPDNAHVARGNPRSRRVASVSTPQKPHRGCPRSLAVQFHDILYTLSLEILYTSARVGASAEVAEAMPWKKMEVREQRVEFVVRALRGGEPLSRLCGEFGISRPTGYCGWRVIGRAAWRRLRSAAAGRMSRPRGPARSWRRRSWPCARSIRTGVRASWPCCWPARASNCRPAPSIACCCVTAWCAMQDRHVPASQRFERDAAQRTVADGLQGAEELAKGLHGLVGDRRP